MTCSREQQVTDTMLIYNIYTYTELYLSHTPILTSVINMHCTTDKIYGIMLWKSMRCQLVHVCHSGVFRSVPMSCCRSPLKSCSGWKQTVDLDLAMPWRHSGNKTVIAMPTTGRQTERPLQVRDDSPSSGHQPDFVLEAGQEAGGDAESRVQEVFFWRRLQIPQVSVEPLWKVKGQSSVSV